jgi:hypothetical protein
LSGVRGCPIKTLAIRGQVGADLGVTTHHVEPVAPILTDTAIRKAKPNDKVQRLFDGGGLYLELAPSGGKWWRLKYRFEGKEKRLSLGTYPDTGLAAARSRRDEARKLLAAGVDPGEQRKAAKVVNAERGGNSFTTVADELLLQRAKRLAAGSAIRERRLLEKDLAPYVGDLPIADITAPVLLAAPT